MFYMENKDVLLAARPDHSVQLYHELVKDGSLSFLYQTFKALPKWISPFINNRKVLFLDSNYRIGYIHTAINLLMYRFNISWLKRFRESKLFSRITKKLLKKYRFKIIHYWPNFCADVIQDYELQHPEVISLAEVYMPNQLYIKGLMEGVYAQYNYVTSNDWEDLGKRVLNNLSKASTILVPSEFVIKTFKDYLPHAHYLVIGYGITIFPNYKKRIVEPNMVVKKFVYAGTISLEKGCDIICEWFSQHPEFELHLYGRMVHDQKAIFARWSSYGNIVFHGAVAKTDLQSVISKYDVGIHMSRFDAYSLSVGELTGAGLPILVSCNTGNKTFIKKHSLGVVSELDMESLGQNILHITNVENYAKYVDNIDNYIASAPKSYSERVIDLYKELLHGEF